VGGVGAGASAQQAHVHEGTVQYSMRVCMCVCVLVLIVLGVSLIAFIHPEHLLAWYVEIVDIQCPPCSLFILCTVFPQLSTGGTIGMSEINIPRYAIT